MALQIGRAIRDGFARTATSTGAVFIWALLCLNIAQAVAFNSLWVTLLTETWDLQEMFPELWAENPSMSYEEFVQTMEQSAVLNVLDASPAVLIGLVVLLWLLGVVVTIGAIRWFVADDPNDLELDLFTRRVFWTVVNLVAAWIVVGILVVAPIAIAGASSAVVGPLAILLVLVALVVSIYLAVTLYFTHIDIAVNGSSFISGLVNSWELTKGNVLMLTVLGAIVLIGGAIVGGLVGFATGLAIGQTSLVSVLINQVLGAVISVVSIGIAAATYDQLRGLDSASTDAAGPDDL